MTQLQTKLGPTRQQWVLLAVLIGALIGLGLFARFYKPTSNIEWRRDFNAARAEAAQTGRPMLLYFTADWCKPCQEMKKNVWPDDSVEQAVNGRTIPVYLDIDLEPVKTIAKHYPVRFIPTMILADARGRPLTQEGRMIGHNQYTSAKHILAMVDAAQNAEPMSDADFVPPPTGNEPAPPSPTETDGTAPPAAASR